MLAPPLAGPRWVLFAGIALAALDLRVAVTSIAPLLGHVSTDVGLTLTDASVLAALPPLVFCVCGMVTAIIARRIGLEWMLLGSLVLSAAGTLGRSLAVSPAGFLTWTVVVMAGLGVGNILIAPLIKRYFAHRLASTTMAYTVFMVTGQALPPVFILGMANTLGWRMAVGLGAVVAVLAIVPWAVSRPWWIRRKSHAGPGPRVSAAQLVRSPLAWGIALMLIANSTVSYCLMAWLPRLLIDDGATPATGSAALAVFTIGALFGALVSPVLITRLRRPAVATVAMPLLWGVGLAGLTFAPNWGTFAWIGITRLGDCLFVSALTLMTLRSRRTETVVVVSGVTQSASYLVSAVVAFGFGMVHTQTGAWTVPMSALTCIVVASGLVGALLTARPRYVEDELEAVAARASA